MSGPLPTANPRRVNKPTIPTTALPIGGFTGSIPAVPKWWVLGKQGQAWWKWAWRTPQAAAWGSGVGIEDFVARRAALVDDLAVLDDVENLDALDLLDVESARRFKMLVGRLAAMACGRLQIIKEMRELDSRLGLSPKAMADLRWKIVADVAPVAAPAAVGVTRIDERRNRLTSAS